MQAVFERDYQKYHREIYVFLYGFLHTEHEAHELLQETFLAYWQAQQDAPMPAGKKRPWLYLVAKRKSLNYIQRRSFLANADPVDVGAQVHAAPSAADQEQLMHVRALMGALSKRESLILQLYSAGLSYQEMAEVLEVETSSIGKLLARAKRSFKQLHDAKQAA